MNSSPQASSSAPVRGAPIANNSPNQYSALATLINQHASQHATQNLQQPQLNSATVAMLQQNLGLPAIQPSPNYQITFVPPPGNVVATQPLQGAGPNGLSGLTQLLQLLQQPAQQAGAPAPSSTTLDMQAGSRVDDEKILINTLCARHIKGYTVRQALESLHGVNNHTGGSWKDFFLTDFDRLCPLVTLTKDTQNHEETIEMERQRQPPDSRGRSLARAESSGPSRLRDPQRSISRSMARRPRSSSRGRSRSKSRAGHRQRVRFSDPLSRSPTPPPAPSLYSSGPRLFTDAEERYIIRSLRWHLLKNPDIPIKQIAEHMSKRAPSRSMASWRCHIHDKYRDEVARLIAEAQSRQCGGDGHADDEDEDDYDHDDDYADRSYIALPVSTSSRQGGSNIRLISLSPAKILDDDPGTDEDVPSMGAAGKPFNNADIRTVAKYIASRSDWDALSTAARWRPFHKKYEQRSDKAWAECHRRYAALIDELVAKYRERNWRREHMRRPSPRGSSPTGSTTEHDEVEKHLGGGEASKRRFQQMDTDDPGQSASSKRHKASD